jgi:hypothetical protein
MQNDLIHYLKDVRNNYTNKGLKKNCPKEKGRFKISSVVCDL